MAAHPGTYSSLCKSYFTPAVPELSRLRPRDEWDARDIVTEVSEVQVVAQLLQGVTSIAGHARLLDPWGQYVRTDKDGKMKGDTEADRKSKEG